MEPTSGPGQPLRNLGDSQSGHKRPHLQSRHSPSTTGKVRSLVQFGRTGEVRWRIPAQWTSPSFLSVQARRPSSMGEGHLLTTFAQSTSPMYNPVSKDPRQMLRRRDPFCAALQHPLTLESTSRHNERNPPIDESASAWISSQMHNGPHHPISVRPLCWHGEVYCAGPQKNQHKKPHLHLLHKPEHGPCKTPGDPHP